MKINGVFNKSIAEMDSNIRQKNSNNKSFSSFLKQSINDVNKLQHQANQAGQDLALGKVDNVHEVMIAAQKAKLSIDLTTKVSNKVVGAYQEIMRLQV